jgi:hypothetical protein
MKASVSLPTVPLEQGGGLDGYLFLNDLKPFFQLLRNFNIA